MPAERSQQIEQLYHAARERDPDQRGAFLDKACTGDEGLRREVESLLAEDDGVKSFLETPALELVRKMSGEDAGRSMIGRQLGSYQCLSLLGKGGMGEVYRARDMKLKRDVAIKILPEEFSGDADRVSRFRREAEVLASLNHQNIAAIYDLGEAGGSRFLVLEFVEGETLAERIGRGPIPVEEVLDIARNICEALEVAHEKGITHRDLKPANIKITPDGKVKVLDFGLAKAIENAPTGTALSNSPTLLSMAATSVGVILGTAAYMAPEQAKGKAVDKRADIWAFAVVVYEMLTGRTMFSGETASETMAQVMLQEPDWSVLPPNTPSRLRDLLCRCLVKDPRNRLRDIGEARIAIEEMVTHPEQEPTATTAVAARRTKAVWIAGAALLLIIAALIPFTLGYFRIAATKDAGAVRLSVPPPEKASFGSTTLAPSPVISPDGRRLAFIATSDGIARLWIRPIDSLEARPLPGTEGVVTQLPFWSPDSRFIGFFAQGKLKKIEVAGGSVQILCDSAGTNFGGTWNRDGVIIFDDGQAHAVPLKRVSAAGGKPEPLTTLDPSRHEQSHSYPYFLLDGDHFLFLARSSAPENNAIMAGSLSSKEVKFLINANSRVAYDPSGYLMFVRDQSLMAQPFDARKLQVTGDAFPVADQLRLVGGSAPFSVSLNGVLAYRTATDSGSSRLTWFDRSGKLLSTLGSIANQRNPELSPDGKRVAIERVDQLTQNTDIFIIEIDSDTTRRLTFDSANDLFPIWSPDGAQVLFNSNRNQVDSIYLMPSSGGTEESILKSESSNRDWSADGKVVVYGNALATETWYFPAFGERKPTLYLKSRSAMLFQKLSPDGRWLAYTSSESGRLEVYVQSFPNPSARWQISTRGGHSPRWRRDGKEIFYLTADQKLTAVPIRATATALEPSTPIPLFEIRVSPFAAGVRQQYDVSADGQRFLVNTLVEESVENPVTVVVNWTAGLKK